MPRLRERTIAAAISIAALAGQVDAANAQATLAAVKARGVVTCGVSDGLPGFSQPGENGSWTGFDVDFCRALAAAIFDDPGKVRYVPLNASERFAALQRGEIDILSRNSTWTLARETKLKILFPVVTYYDGQGFLIRKSQKARSPLEFEGLKVCAQAGTTSERNTADYLRSNNVKATLITSVEARDAVKAYDEERCDVFTSDVSQLYAERLTLSSPGDHTILPDIISKEPLGPAVRQGDEQWATMVKWVHHAMVNAEELGVTSRMLDRALKSEKPEIKRLVGTEGTLGEDLGLSNDWVARIVRHVGSYGEVFERNVGAASKIGIPRGLNHLWTTGGIQYAPPLE